MYQLKTKPLKTNTLGERLGLLLSEKDITVYRLAADLKLNKMTLSNYLNDKIIRPNDNIIEPLSKFFDVRPEWLKSGKGDRGRYKMLSVENKVAEAVPVNYTEMNVHYAPVVSYYAYGGYMSGFGDPEYLDNLPKLPFAGEVEYKGEYVWFEAKGESMVPSNVDDIRDAIFERDMLLCRNIKKEYWKSRLHIHKWKNFVIVTNDGIIVKQIIKHEVDKGIVTVHSLNSDYADREIDLRDVAQIFNVVEIRRR